MTLRFIPAIDPKRTGENIAHLRRAAGLSVRDLQSYLGFESPQAVYKWQQGKIFPRLTI